MGKHNADGHGRADQPAGQHRATGASFSVRGRDATGTADGVKPSTERESDLSGYSQAEADQRSARHQH